MHDHHQHTEFLKQCLRYDEDTKCQELAQEITRIQRDERCVQRAAWLMAALTTLAVASLVYPAILLENFLYGAPEFVVNLVRALGVGSLVSLLAFVGLGKIYRRKLDQRREECRQRVAKLLESRLGKPGATPCREGFISDKSDGPFQVVAEDKRSPARIESAARG